MNARSMPASVACIALSAVMVLRASALQTAASLPTFNQPRACGGLQQTNCLSVSYCHWLPLSGCHKLPDNLQRSRCNNGSAWVDCWGDAELKKCGKGTAGPKPDARWAFVFTHSLERGGFIGFKDRLDENLQTFQKKAAHLGNTDIVLLVPKKGSIIDGNGKRTVHDLSPETKDGLSKQGVVVIEVPWALPPNMKFMPKPVGKRDQWCGAKDLMRVHTLGLHEYAAVAYFDTDTQLTHQGDIGMLLRCAASGPDGHFLSATGPLSPLNVGMFAVKPSKELAKAAMLFAQTADFDKVGGWGDAGLSPNKGRYIGAECGQGFMHTLMYKDAPVLAKAVQRAGLQRPRAVQVDRCIWNRQHDVGCAGGDGSGMDCSTVVMIHKDNAKTDKCKQKHKEIPVSLLQGDFSEHDYYDGEERTLEEE